MLLFYLCKVDLTVTICYNHVKIKKKYSAIFHFNNLNNKKN